MGSGYKGCSPKVNRRVLQALQGEYVLLSSCPLPHLVVQRRNKKPSTPRVQKICASLRTRSFTLQALRFLRPGHDRVCGLGFLNFEPLNPGLRFRVFELGPLAGFSHAGNASSAGFTGWGSPNGVMLYRLPPVLPKVAHRDTPIQALRDRELISR